MDDLVQFLRARLDEGEKVVRDELCVNCGNPIVPLRGDLGITGYSHGGGRVNEHGEWERNWEGRRCQGSITGAEAVQNPARVLAEVEARRQLLDRYEAYHWHGPAAPTSPDPRDHVEDTGACRTCITARILALPYADHPDYREEWRP